jgi:hypothetical protein
VEIRSAIAKELPEAEARKAHFETKLLEKEYGAVFSQVEEALKKDDLAKVAEDYKKIDYAKLATQSFKEGYVGLTTRLEEKVKDVLTNVFSIIETDVAKAEELFQAASNIGDVLPKFSEVRKLTSGFKHLLNAQKLKGKYETAMSQQSYYDAYAHLSEIEALLKKEDFHVDRKESYAAFVEKGFDELKKYKRDIGLLDPLVKSAEDLRKEFNESTSGDADLEAISTEEAVKSLPDERIKYFTDSLNSISQALAIVNRDNVKQKYEELENELKFFKQDLDAELWKRGADKGAYVERSHNISSLIALYNERGEEKREAFYIRKRQMLDQKRMEEIQKIKKP